ncbi:MAG: hypothetical protein WB566_20275 [Terriglobales bacterium]
MECDPPVSADVLYVAIPPLTVPVPRVVLPSVNVTVPVTVAGVTVAVNVTGEPYVDGFADDPRATLVPALLTVCVSTDDALPL